jgi:DNA-binding transcriptional regulator YbjK
MVNEPRQERSKARREALLRAAIELLAVGGARALTHRAVAARAGLPPASTTYYFDTIQQLTDAALELHVTDRVAELEVIVSAALAAGETPEEVGAAVAVSLVDRAADMLVGQFELYLEAARNPALRPTVGEALAASEQFAARALKALGARDPEGAAPAFLALVDGFALHRLGRPRPRDEEVAQLRKALQALFVTELMDAGEHDHWLARLRQPPSGGRPGAEPAGR